MQPIHKQFTDLLMTKRLQTLQSVDDAVDRVRTMIYTRFNTVPASRRVNFLPPESGPFIFNNGRSVVNRFTKS